MQSGVRDRAPKIYHSLRPEEMGGIIGHLNSFLVALNHPMDSRDFRTFHLQFHDKIFGGNEFRLEAVARILLILIIASRHENISHFSLLLQLIVLFQWLRKNLHEESPLTGEVEIGYAIAEAQCGKGYATQAVSAMSLWALRNLKVQKIFGVVATENIASSRVLAKCGYILRTQSMRRYQG